MRLQAQLRKAAEEDKAAEVGALLGREDKAQLIDAADEVRCRCRHSMRIMPTPPDTHHRIQYYVGAPLL